METMSPGPRAVTLSQRRPISAWCWWPATSKRITPPFAEREIKVRGGTLSWRHTHKSLESQHSFQAALIYRRLTQRMRFSHGEMERTGDRAVQGETWGAVVEAMAPLWRHVGVEGGAPQGLVAGGAWIQKRKSWAETETDGHLKKGTELLLQVALRFCELSEWTGGRCRRNAWMTQWEIIRSWGMSPTLWATAELKTMRFCNNRVQFLEICSPSQGWKEDQKVKASSRQEFFCRF